METTHLLEDKNSEFRNAIMPVTIFVGIEALLGFIGNIFVIVVFSLRYRTCNFKYFMLFLAITDITSCLTTVPGEIVTQLNWYNYPYPTVCKVKSFFNMFTVCCEDLCLLLIGIDRFRKVCRPKQQQISPRLALKLCVAIYATAFAMALPIGVLWGTRTYEDDYKGTKINVTVCEKDEKYIDSHDSLYVSLSIAVVLSFTLLTMFVLYVLIAKKLLCSKREDDVMTRQRESSNVADTQQSYTQVTTNPVRENIDEDNNSSFCVTGDFTDHANTNRSIDTKTSKNIIKTDKKAKLTLSQRVRQKTRIMFILTVVFIVTTVLYLTLLTLIAKGVLNNMTDSSKVIYFFFFRLYFINHVINPIVYGCLDKRFQEVMRSCWTCGKFKIFVRHSRSFSVTDSRA